MDQVKANLKLIEVKQLRQDIEKMKEIHFLSMEQQEKVFQEKLNKMNNELNFIMDELKAFLIEHRDELQHTKTLAKYTQLPQGNLIINKSVNKIVKTNDDDLMKWAEIYAPEHIKETVVKKIDWATIKKDLEVLDGAIISRGSGEILEIPGVEIQETAEEFDVKF